MYNMDEVVIIFLVFYESANFLLTTPFEVVMGFFSKLKPLTAEQKSSLHILENVLSTKRISLIKNLLKDGKVSLEMERIDTSMAGSVSYPFIKEEADDVDASAVNADIKAAFQEKLFTQFSDEAFEKISKLIAPHITGMEAIKKAVVIQLFAAQPVHILLLGDPGTGKTDILRSGFNLSPISSFGLGMLIAFGAMKYFRG